MEPKNEVTPQKGDKRERGKKKKREREGKKRSLETLFEGLSQFSSVQFSSVQFSHSVVSDSLRLHESQHARSPCPSPTPRVYSN